MKEKVETKKYVPLSKEVVVKPIMRQRNDLVSDPEHEAFFLFGTSTIDYCIPQDRSGVLFDIFESREQQEWLEEQLDTTLNLYSSSSPLRTRKVRLGKDPKTFRLDVPSQLLDYLILKANWMYIAPNPDMQFKRKEYRYVMTDKDFEQRERVSASSLKKKAYKAAARLEAEGKQAMVDFLTVYGKKVSPQSKEDFLVAEIDKIIEDDMNLFLELLEDKENYELKLLINSCVNAGLIDKRGKKYYLPGGDALSGAGVAPLLNNAVEYLKLPMNGDILDSLKARLDASKDK